MSTKIYVGNLPYSVTDASLESNFAEFGTVTSAKVMMDRDSGRSKGFGFVEMTTADACQAAISALHGMSVDGRSITVNLARPVKKAAVLVVVRMNFAPATAPASVMAKAATVAVATDN